MANYIFIRSYDKDLEWLKYCLASIEKFCVGFEKPIVVVPEPHQDEFWIHQIETKGCKVYRDDYLGQQSTKLHADQYISNWAGDDTVSYVDSDCMFFREISKHHLITLQDKPIFWMTEYSILGSTVPWKALTERVLDEGVHYEFMRRLPITVKLKHLAEFREWFKGRHGVVVDTFIRSLASRDFSEFNALGAWLFKYKNDEYLWKDTMTTPIDEEIVHQGWSWAGMNEEGRAHRRKILGIV